MITGIIIGVGLCSLDYMFQVNENNSVQYARDTYGDFAFGLEDEEIAIDEIVQGIPGEKKIITCSNNNYIVDGIYHTIYCGTNEMLKMLGYSIVIGNFPVEEYEILIDTNYLIDHKMKVDDCIGKTVELQINDQIERYNIVGVISYHNIFEDQESESSEYIYIKSATENNNMYYVSFDDYCNYDENLKQISNLLTEQQQTKLYPNWGIYYSLGFGSEQSVYEKSEITFLFILTVMLIGFAVILYNALKIYLYKSYEPIAIMNMIGISKYKIILSILVRIICLLDIGLLIGAILVSCYKIQTYQYMEISKSVSKAFIAIQVVTVVVVMPLFWKLQHMSSYAMLRSKKMDLYQLNRIKKKALFGRRSKGFLLVLAKNNLRINLFMHGIAILCISCSIMILVMGIYYVQINTVRIQGDENVNYKYTFINLCYYDEESMVAAKEVYEDIIEICNARKLKFYSYYEKSCEAFIDQDKIDKSYMEYLDNYISSEGISQLYNKNSSYKTQINVVSYDELTYKQVLDNNNLEESDELEEMVILNKITNHSRLEQFALYYDYGDKLTLFFPQEDYKESIRIRGVVNDIPVYPKNEMFTLTSVVHPDIFTKYFKQDIPNAIYISEHYNSNENKELLEEFASNKLINISYPKEEYEQALEMENMGKTIIMLVGFLLIFTGFLIIVSNNLTRIYLNQREYVTMIAIGMRYSQILRIIINELMILAAESILLAFPITYVVTRHMYLMKYPTTGIYLYKMPIALFIIVTLVVMICISFMAVPIYQGLKSLKVNQILKQDE